MIPRPRPRPRAIAAACVILAAGLTVAGVPVTSAQGPTLYATRIDGGLPVDDPFARAWDGARPVDVLLSGQPVVPPKLLEPTVASVRVRALTDGAAVAILLEWPDETADESALGVDEFADSAAIQFALGSGASICMGMQAGGLNIWHWKADWAADLAARRDVGDAWPNAPDDLHFAPGPPGDALGEDGFLAGRAAGNPRSAATLPSAVEDLNAIGFGSLTTQAEAGQNVHGASGHRDGAWRVVMSRSLLPGDPNDAPLRPGATATVVAFALWDGARGDRDGQKSVSSWVALSIPREPIGMFDAWPFLLMLMLALVLSGVVMAYGARQPAVGLGWPNGRPDGGVPTDGGRGSAGAG